MGICEDHLPSEDCANPTPNENVSATVDGYAGHAYIFPTIYANYIPRCLTLDYKLICFMELRWLKKVVERMLVLWDCVNPKEIEFLRISMYRDEGSWQSQCINTKEMGRPGKMRASKKGRRTQRAVVTDLNASILKRLVTVGDRDSSLFVWGWP